MSQPLSTDRVRHFWRELQRLIADRAKRERENATGRAAEHEAIGRSHTAARERIANRRQAERSVAETERDQARTELLARSQAELKAAKSEHSKGREQALDRFAHGVFFVALASLTAADQIPTAIAEAISYTFSGQDDQAGELLGLSWRWHERGRSPDDDYWRFLVDLVDAAARVWRKKDPGLWALRGNPEHFPKG